ncbi:MAG TPA: GNAT family N-acetyltransferase [Clostridia bacterium]|nr:GNAT family N-acetyltransferase [Clostridia bacterium]
MIYTKLKSNYQNQIDRIIEHIKTLSFESQIVQQFYSYTLHDLDHFTQVARNAEKIVRGFDLSNEELFILLAACYCHDLGMASTIEKQSFKIVDQHTHRKYHAHLSRQYIFNHMRQQIPDEKYREAIGIVSEGHGRWDWDAAFFNDINGEEDVIRIRFLTLILSLADLLDLRNDRKNPPSYNSIDDLLQGNVLDNISKVHWLKHYYSKQPDIFNNNGTIEITLKGEVGKKGIADKIPDIRASLIQELIQGEILNVLQHPTTRKYLDLYFNVKLIKAESDWPSYVHLSEGAKFEFPEALVGDVMMYNFLHPKKIELKSHKEYKDTKITAFLSEKDLQISFVERPASILPSKIKKKREDIERGTDVDNWDIVLWDTDYYIEDINKKFHEKSPSDITNRIYAIFDALDMIKSGSMRKIYIESSDLSLPTSTATKFIVKHAHKFLSEERVLEGGNIEILTDSQKELYYRMWENAKQKLGISINIDEFKSFITPAFAYSFSRVPLLKIAKALNNYRQTERNSEETRKINTLLTEIENNQDKLNTKEVTIYNMELHRIKSNKVINHQFVKFQESQLPVLRLLDKCCFNYPWKYNKKSIKKLLDKDSVNFILEVNDSAVGYLFAVIEGKSLYIRKMCIHPIFRRMGFAFKLLEIAMSVGDIVELQLHVRQINTAAISLYEKFGFERNKEIPNHFKKGHTDSPETTAIEMRKLLVRTLDKK